MDPALPSRPDPNADAEKQRLRRLALARRDALSAAQRAAGARTLAKREFPVRLTAGTTVSGYVAIRSELDPAPLLQRLAEVGAQLALPAVIAPGQPLVLRAWAFEEPLTAGRWGLSEPRADAPEVTPDIVLVPLAAFDRDGHRIGYGAGFYDRTLARLRENRRILAIGLAFAAQEIPKVPAGGHDVPLDLVLTEREVIDLRQD